MEGGSAYPHGVESRPLPPATGTSSWGESFARDAPRFGAGVDIGCDAVATLPTSIDPIDCFNCRVRWALPRRLFSVTVCSHFAAIRRLGC